ncbi:hypothetical protein T06_12486 [Trichinella sp. T6]|nr:hypothetical protein T06_12486 [Trichinella sp. T6]
MDYVNTIEENSISNGYYCTRVLCCPGDSFLGSSF